MSYEIQLAKFVRLLQCETDENYKQYKNLEAPTVKIIPGRSYDKLISNGSKFQSKVIGFVTKKDNPKKGLKQGDVLMAATWKQPALNQKEPVRGSIFDNDGKNATNGRGNVRYHGC